MRGAVAVRINDGVADRSVTGKVTGLKFSKQSDGGHRAASFTLTVPTGTFADLGPSDKVYVSDARTGLPLWEGYLDAPTPVRGANGESYAISALGAMIRAADETRALVYVTSDLGAFEKSYQSAPSSSIESGNWVDDPIYQRVRTHLTPSEPVGPGFNASAESRLYERALMPMGGIRIGSVISGKSDIGYRTTFFHNTGSVDVADAGGMNSGFATVEMYAGAGFPSGSTTVFALALARTGGATNIADDVTWTDWVDISTIGQRMNRSGLLLVGVAQLITTTYVRAHWVVEDLLGRVMRFCDPLTSSVAPGSRDITELAYTDGATAQRVLDDLSDYEPDHLWEILHSTADGHIFNYRPWPTDPRYEISTRDGYSEQGSDVDLCNRVVVSWTDKTGNSRTLVVTATSTQYPALLALDVAGRIRDAEPISLPEGSGSDANAALIGAAVLAEVAGRPVPAKAVVRRPIRDLYTGSNVMPWEIETGYLVTVRETGNLHRLTAMEYDDDSCSTSLDMGYPSLTREQRLAALKGR